MSNEQESITNDDLNQDFNPSSKRRKKNRRNWIIVILLVLFGSAGYYWKTSNVEVAQDQPLIITVSRGNIENTIASAGSLQPFDLVDVGAQVSGQLKKLHVEVGDLVEEGQLLAEIDARVQENRVEASRASIEAQEAQIVARKASLTLAIANKERQERLMSANATSQLEFDNAVSNLASAEASLIQLEKQIIQNRASLASDETELEFSKIYAPAAGTVVSIEMNEGRTLNANQQAPTILRIADLSTMTVETEISEADIGNVKKGLDVYFTTLGGGNRRWYSTLRQILPTPNIDSNVVLYTGLFDIENSDESLFSDMTAQVYFITSSAQNVLTVPVGALTYQDRPEATFPGRLATAGAEPNGENIREAIRAEVAAGGVTPEQSERIRAAIRARAAEGGGAFSGNAGGSFSRGTAGQTSESERPRAATVQLLKEDGTFETREVTIGVTSRVSAEVVSGLEEGDKVVAGIIQADTGDAGNSNQGGFRGPPGGFGGF